MRHRNRGVLEVQIPVLCRFFSRDSSLLTLGNQAVDSEFAPRLTRKVLDPGASRTWICGWTIATPLGLSVAHAPRVRVYFERSAGFVRARMRRAQSSVANTVRLTSEHLSMLNLFD